MLELFVTKYIQCNVMDYGQQKDEKCKKKVRNNYHEQKLVK